MTPYVLFCVKDRSLFVINLASLSKYDTEKKCIKKDGHSKAYCSRNKKFDKKKCDKPYYEKEKVIFLRKFLLS